MNILKAILLSPKVKVAFVGLLIAVVSAVAAYLEVGVPF